MRGYLGVELDYQLLLDRDVDRSRLGSQYSLLPIEFEHGFADARPSPPVLGHLAFLSGQRNDAELELCLHPRPLGDHPQTAVSESSPEESSGVLGTGSRLARRLDSRSY